MIYEANKLFEVIKLDTENIFKIQSMNDEDLEIDSFKIINDIYLLLKHNPDVPYKLVAYDDLPDHGLYGLRFYSCHDDKDNKFPKQRWHSFSDIICFVDDINDIDKFKKYLLLT